MTKTLPSVAAAALLTLGITLGTTVSVTAGLAPTASAIDTTTIAPVSYTHLRAHETN